MAIGHRGAEFSRIEQSGIPEEAVHRLKQATNDIAVVDRTMQTLEQDQAAILADGDDSNWKEALPIATEAYNRRPHSAVYGAAETVEERAEQDFRVLQDTARKGLLNRSSQLRNSKALREAGPFVLRFHQIEALVADLATHNKWGDRGREMPTMWLATEARRRSC